MKILYISSLVLKKNSSASIRNVGLINGLVSNGHEVSVLTIKYPNDFQDSYLSNSISKDVTIYQSDLKLLSKYLSIRVDKKEDSKNKFSVGRNSVLKTFKKIVKDIYFFPDTDREWISKYNQTVFSEQFDLIISSSDTKTSHFVAEKITKKLPDSMWYQIWGDPWDDDLNISKINKGRARYREKKMLEKADKIFYVSLPTTEFIKKKYPNIAEKISYLGRSYLEKCEGIEIYQQEEIVFTYTGILTKDRNLFNLINKIEEYNHSNDKKIRLNIYGYIDTQIETKLKQYSFVSIKGSVGFNKIKKIYRESDILVFIDNSGGTTQIPGKLYDYFGTDRPILALVEDKNTPVSKFILSTNRTVLMENNEDNIRLEFLKDLKKSYIMPEFSGSNIASKIFNENKEQN